MIETIDLHKSFGKLEVLKGIDVKIEQNEVVVVIGPSGSGKSTFLRCLNSSKGRQREKYCLKDSL